MIYDFRFTIFSSLPRSLHEIGTAGISQGKSAKKGKFELKNAKKANFMEAIRC